MPNELPGAHDLWPSFEQNDVCVVYTQSSYRPLLITYVEPLPSTAPGEVWGSDAMARMLQALEVPYLALVPGASFRGLHDSIVNDLGNRAPQMLLCLHEENAVAIAHGYAKASGRMMGTVLHSNVGLLHATMGIFNAWCDRAPMLILGATGPWDAAKRSWSSSSAPSRPSSTVVATSIPLARRPRTRERRTESSSR